MPDKARVYLEVGDKKAFATSVDWPGWSRSGRDEGSALEALVTYAERYRRSIGTASRGMPRPTSVDDLDLVERVRGDASTDFGVLAKGTSSDADALEPKEVRRLVRVLRAAWEAFDRAAQAAASAELRKGPRGGGRDVDKIVEHVSEGEGGYLPRLGAEYRAPKGADQAEVIRARREAALHAIEVRSNGGDPPKPPRKNLWTVRQYIRRSAWHALDHAWEIEDRRTN